MGDNVIKGVISGLGEIGKEAMEKGVKEGVEISQRVITGQELLGLKKVDENRLEVMEKNEEIKKQEEMAHLRRATAGQGRDVEGEVKVIREERGQKEDEEQRQFLEKIRLQREEEAREREKLMEVPGNQKREAAKRQMAPGKKKAGMPDAAQMSQTSEFKGGKID